MIPDLFGCPQCGASVRPRNGWCPCGHFLGTEAPPRPDEPWRDIGISPIIEDSIYSRLERDAAENREALGVGGEPTHE